ncbi:hypothetical protein AYI69_g11146 [Smittium culicis]|uniref:Uncharacterized protein n=1 Tax=Smittium culicis TaxID=133412 RepID=A0A1R1X0T8_9FUNG|nr:hypothetical protein AYI69_g11146 [Smittium culicis]
MRTSNNRTVGRTPAEMLYGMKLMTPEVWNSCQPNIIIEQDPVSHEPYYINNDILKEKMYQSAKEKEKKQEILEKKLPQRSLNRIAHPMYPINGGPFLVEEKLDYSAFRISDMQGREDTVNLDKIKKFNIGTYNKSKMQKCTTRTVYPKLFSNRVEPSA